MKKSKLSVGLVASFIGALAMSACNQDTSAAVNEENGTLVKLVDYNGDQIVVTPSSIRVARESWGLRSSHCRAEETSPRRVSGTYYSSPGKAGISGLYSFWQPHYT